MSTDGFWLEEFPVAVTVTDAQGTILTMNARSRKSFEADGGAALIGTSVFDCHPEPPERRLTNSLRAARRTTTRSARTDKRRSSTKSPGTVTAPSPASWRSRSRLPTSFPTSTATEPQRTTNSPPRRPQSGFSIPRALLEPTKAPLEWQSAGSGRVASAAEIGPDARRARPPNRSVAGGYMRMRAAEVRHHRWSEICGASRQCVVSSWWSR
jgi:hypothetical protein